MQAPLRPCLSTDPLPHNRFVPPRLGGELAVQQTVRGLAVPPGSQLHLLRPPVHRMCFRHAIVPGRLGVGGPRCMGPSRGDRRDHWEPIVRWEGRPPRCWSAGLLLGGPLLGEGKLPVLGVRDTMGMWEGLSRKAPETGGTRGRSVPCAGACDPVPPPAGTHDKMLLVQFHHRRHVLHPALHPDFALCHQQIRQDAGTQMISIYVHSWPNMCSREDAASKQEKGLMLVSP